LLTWFLTLTIRILLLLARLLPAALLLAGLLARVLVLLTVILAGVVRVHFGISLAGPNQRQRKNLDLVSTIFGST
jgi:hypothetical protein